MRNTFLLLLIIVLLVSGCGGVAESDPAEATMQYLQALAEQDKTKVLNLSCKEWEEQSAMEVDALLSVGSELVNLSCEVMGEVGEDKLVQCNGELRLTYQDEIRSIDLSRRVYSMRMEDGSWRVCSYK